MALHQPARLKLNPPPAIKGGIKIAFFDQYPLKTSQKQLFNAINLRTLSY